MIDAHLRGKRIETADIKTLIIGGQTGVDGIQFVLNSTINGEDLTDLSLNWYVQFKNKYGEGGSILLTGIIEGDLIKLPWIPGVTATQVSGNLQIQIYAMKVEDEVLTKKWVSESATIYVEENLNPSDITQAEPTLFDQYLVLFNASKDIATAAATAAASSENNAASSASDALASKNAAATSESNAASSASDALASKNAAATSESNAASSASDALASKNAAATSESNAASSASDALASKNAAATSESNAASSASDALASKNAAATSESNAASSASDALASKNAAATSESNTASSASDALASKNAAATSESNAASSASDALASKNAAATSESNTASSASDALASKNAAATSESNAASSEASALASKIAAEAAAASVQISSYYGLRRRSDGVYTRTGAAATMTPARSNGTYNPAISDFRKVKPWSDIRLCLMDKIGNVVAVQGDDNFTTMANETNPDGSHVWNFGSLFFPFYMRIWEGVDESSFAFKEWDVSALKLPGYNMCPAFVREDGTVRPYIVIASYKTGLDTDGKVCSKPNVAPLVNTSTLSFDTKYTELDVDTRWLGNHFTTNDVWKMLVCIEFGTMDIQNAVGAGISSSMPYSSSSSYQLTEATVDGNAVTIADSGQPFYVGMDVQIGSSYSNSSYASNRKVTDVDTSTTPGSMIITVDGDSFSAPIGGWIVSWGQSDSATNLLQIGTGCGWISQWESEVRSHVYIYGLVDPYANVFEVERGKMRKAKHFWINFSPLTSSGITDPEASGFIDCGEFSTGEATYGWISDFKIVTLGLKQMQLVSEVGGNSIGDVIYYADDARTGTYVCFRGGGWYSGSYIGPFYESWGGSPSNTNIFGGDRGIILEPALQAS